MIVIETAAATVSLMTAINNLSSTWLWPTAAMTLAAPAAVGGVGRVPTAEAAVAGRIDGSGSIGATAAGGAHPLETGGGPPARRLTLAAARGGAATLSVTAMTVDGKALTPGHLEAAETQEWAAAAAATAGGL